MDSKADTGRKCQQGFYCMEITKRNAQDSKTIYFKSKWERTQWTRWRRQEAPEAQGRSHQTFFSLQCQKKLKHRKEPTNSLRVKEHRRTLGMTQIVIHPYKEPAVRSQPRQPPGADDPTNRTRQMRKRPQTNSRQFGDRRGKRHPTAPRRADADAARRVFDRIWTDAA